MTTLAMWHVELAASPPTTAPQQHCHRHQQCRLNVSFFLSMWRQKTTTTQTPPKAAIFLPLTHTHTHTHLPTTKKHNHLTLAPMPQVDCFYYLENVALKVMLLDCKKGTIDCFLFFGGRGDERPPQTDTGIAMWQGTG